MKHQHLYIPALFTLLLLTGCGREELQSFEYYLLNPEKLTKTIAYCNKTADSADETFCLQIGQIHQKYEAIEADYQAQTSYMNEFGGLYPEIERKNKQLLEETARLMALKKQGLANN